MLGRKLVQWVVVVHTVQVSTRYSALAKAPEDGVVYQDAAESSDMDATRRRLRVVDDLVG